MIPNIHRSNSCSTMAMSPTGSCVPGGTFLPSRSVDPEASTTWMRASACLTSSRNWFPRPFPFEAPSTRPATSTIFTGMSLVPFTHAEFLGLSVTPISLQTHWVLMWATPTLGWMVVNG